MKKYDHFKIPMMLMLAMVLLVGCQEQTTATEEPAHTEVADMTEASYTGEYRGRCLFENKSGRC